MTSIQTTSQIISRYFGFHASVAGGLSNALISSKEMGCNAVQIFSRNPRGWFAKPLTPQDIQLFRDRRQETGIRSVTVHSCYLINMAAADSEMRRKSIIAFREEIERCLAIGAEFLVFHPGSAKGTTETESIKLCADSLQQASRDLNLKGFRILLENTAGQGDAIGYRFEHLRDIIALCPGLNLGVCLDTCHAFAAGYDLRDGNDVSATLTTLGSIVGTKNVCAVHFNDSKAAYNSRVDRHWHIGKGEIGIEGMRLVAQDKNLANAAFLLETPQADKSLHAENIARLRSFLV
ncbi:MAG: deoxyribonuclease IV [Pyrinomonadaceae bacterium]